MSIDYRASVEHMKRDYVAAQEASEELESIRERHKKGKLSKRGLSQRVIDYLRHKLSQRTNGRELRA
jgi:hypothetical protein